MRYLIKLSILLCTCWLLVACGGGSSGGNNNGGNSSSSVIPAPTANAGADQTLALGATVTLDASASTTTLANTTLSYQWSLVRKPATSTAQLSGADVVKPTFVADVPGTYEAEVSVSDGTRSSNDRVVITVTNDTPIAIVRTEFNELIGTTVILDASGSIAPTGIDSRDLVYQWTLTEKPDFSQAVLAQSMVESNHIYLDLAGTYKATLVIRYQEKASEPVEVVITASASNTQPIADAGGPYTIARGQTLTLDGSASSDADGDNLTYRWSIGILNGSALRVETALTGANTAKPSFTPDVVGNWTLTLVVYDGTTPSNPVSVYINVTKPEGAANVPPVASFPTSQRYAFFTPKDSDEVELGVIVWSSGNSWDVDGNYIGGANRKFRWISTPPGYVQSDLSASGSFSFTPTVEGQYTVELTVNDGELDGVAPVRRTFTARTGANVAPTAAIAVDAGTILVGNTGWFDARGSADKNGDPLTYTWYLFDKPEGSNATFRYEDVTLENGTILKNARAGIVADKPGAYVALLAVTDSHGVTSSAVIVPSGRVLAKAKNNPPSVTIPGAYSLANIWHNPTYPYWGMDQTQPAYTGAQISLSPIYTDPDLDELYYLWTLVEQPVGSDLPDAATSSYLAFTPQVAGNYTYTVVASDGMATSAPQTITVKVVDINAYPSLKLSGDTIYVGEYVDIGSIPPNLAAMDIGDNGTLTLPFRTDYNAMGLTVLYKLTAQGSDYTITGIDLSTEYPGTGVVQLIGLSEGQVIKKGESVNFAVVSPADFHVREHDAHFRWQFKIKERADWWFDLDFNHTKF